MPFVAAEPEARAIPFLSVELRLRPKLLRPVFRQQGFIGFLACPPIFDGFPAERQLVFPCADIEAVRALANLKRQLSIAVFLREISELLRGSFFFGHRGRLGGVSRPVSLSVPYPRQWVRHASWLQRVPGLPAFQ
jgi:hypothetical protein